MEDRTGAHRNTFGSGTMIDARPAHAARLRTLRDVALRIPVATGLCRARRRLTNAAPIFCFHNVVADATAAFGERSLHVSAGAFADYAEWIGATYEVIPLRELLEHATRGRAVSGAAAISFDDGYAGVFSNALPVLRRHGMPSTIFVVADAADRPRAFWWDVLASEGALSAGTRMHYLRAQRGDTVAILGERPPVTPPADYLPSPWSVLEAVRHEVALEAHTVTHRNLSALGSDDVRAELARSRTAIAERIGETPRLISYPYGAYDAQVLDAARRERFDGGLTMDEGLTAGGHDPFAVPRVNVPAGITLDALECRASGFRLSRSRA